MTELSWWSILQSEVKGKELSAGTAASLKSGRFRCLVKSLSTGALGSGGDWEEERVSGTGEILCKHGLPSLCPGLTGQPCFILNI